MYSFIIQQIQCYRTQDDDQTDELKLIIYIDGKAKAIFRHTMITGEQWSLNRHYTFQQKATAKLWEEDGQRKSSLAEIQVNIDTEKGAYENTFQQNGGKYTLSYATDQVPSTNRPKIRGKVAGKLKGQKLPSSPSSTSTETTAKIVIRPKLETSSTTPSPSSVIQGTRPSPEMDSYFFDAFAPSRHGFPFTNSFRLNINLGIPFIPKISSRYGLCGGMAAIAADCFLQKQSLPITRNIPKTGEPLYNLLLERQLQTFGKHFSNIPKFFSWWLLLSTFKTQQKSVRELKRVMQSLDQGKPIQLGLIYVDEKTGKLWDNHQVLAYGYEQANDETVYLQIYDPNYPKKNDVYIKTKRVATNMAFNLRKVDRIICEQHIPNRGKKDVRGFFAIPVRSKKIPANLVA